MSSQPERLYSHLPGEVVNLAFKVSHRRQDYELLATYMRTAAPHTQALSVDQAALVEIKAGNCFLVRCNEHEVVELITQNKRLKKFYWTANGTRRLLKRELAPDSRVTMIYIIQKVRDLVSKRCIALPDSDLWLVMYLPPRSVPLSNDDQQASSASAVCSSSTSSYPFSTSATASATATTTTTTVYSSSSSPQLPFHPDASSSPLLRNTLHENIKAFHSLGISSPFYADDAAQPFPPAPSAQQSSTLHARSSVPPPLPSHKLLDSLDDMPVFRRAMPKRRREQQPQRDQKELLPAEQQPSRSRARSSRDGVISPVPEAMTVGAEAESIHPLNPKHPHHPLESGLDVLDHLDPECPSWLQARDDELLMDLTSNLLSSTAATTRTLTTPDSFELLNGSNLSPSAQQKQSTSTQHGHASLLTPEHLLTSYLLDQPQPQHQHQPQQARFPSSSLEPHAFSSNNKRNMVYHWGLDSLESSKSVSANSSSHLLGSADKHASTSAFAPFVDSAFTHEPRSALQTSSASADLGTHHLFPRGYFSAGLSTKTGVELGETPLFIL